MILIRIKSMTSIEKRMLQDLYNNAFNDFYPKVNNTDNLYSINEVIDIWNDYFKNKKKVNPF